MFFRDGCVNHVLNKDSCVYHVVLSNDGCMNRVVFNNDGCVNHVLWGWLCESCCS